MSPLLMILAKLFVVNNIYVFCLVENKDTVDPMLIELINNEIDMTNEESDATAIDFSILAQCDAHINTYGKVWNDTKLGNRV